MWLLGDTISDLLIAGAMLWIVRTAFPSGSIPPELYLEQLYSNRKNDIHFGTSKMLAKLVKLVVETNSLTGKDAVFS